MRRLQEPISLAGETTGDTHSRRGLNALEDQRSSGNQQERSGTAQEMGGLSGLGAPSAIVPDSVRDLEIATRGHWWWGRKGICVVGGIRCKTFCIPTTPSPSATPSRPLKWGG